MADKIKVYTYKMHDLVWAKMPSYCSWPGRIVEPNTPALAKMKRSPSQHCIFFFGTNNYAWIEEKNLKPYLEFKEQNIKNGKPKDLFQQSMVDIESFIENPSNFSALFETKTPVQKKKATPKPKKAAELEADFDSLKSDSSVPSSPNVAKTTPKQRKRSTSARSVEKPKTAEKAKKVPAVKRKATRESEPEEEIEENIVVSVPAKKSRKSSQASYTTPTRSEVFDVIDQEQSDGETDTAELVKVASDMESVPSRTVFGFVGIGIMGHSICERLLNSGHELVIWNRTSSKCDDIVDKHDNCSVVSTPREVFEQSQIIFICVSDHSAVDSVLHGTHGFSSSDNSTMDKGIVMLSSIDNNTSRSCLSTLSLKGSLRYLEAQMQGTKKHAQEGSLVLLTAGDESLSLECKSCFDVISRSNVYLGENVESAIKMNMILQTIAGVTLTALAESMALADHLGLQQSDILEVMALSNLKSEFIMEKGEAIVHDDFADTSKVSMKLETMQKDLRQGIEFADSMEQPLPLVAAANEMFKEAKRMGYSQHDSTAIYYKTECKYPANVYSNGSM